MTKNLLNISIVRNGVLKIVLDVSDDLKTFFKTANPEIREARYTKFTVNGSGTILYTKVPQDEDAAYNRIARDLDVNDDTSESDLSKFELPNIAFLRIAAAYTGPVTIELPRIISEETLKEYIVQFKDAVVKLYKKYVRAVNINCSLTIEEVI